MGVGSGDPELEPSDQTIPELLRTDSKVTTVWNYNNMVNDYPS